MAPIPPKSPPVPKKSGILHLGIDLGTSRTTIAASNGVRETVSSFVGYPKDAVSRKLLRQEILFGDAAREKRLSLLLYRPLEKGVIKNHFPQASFTLNMVKQIKEKSGFVTETTAPVRVQFPVAGKPTFFDITDLLRDNCRKVIPPLVAAVRKLLSSFDPEFQHRLRNHVLLGGGGSQLSGLGRALEEALREYGGGRVATVEEPLYAGANGALKLACDMPAAYWKELKR